MDESTKDKLEGNLHLLQGAIKEKAGQIMNNPDLIAEGQVEKTAGELQKILSRVEATLNK